VDFLDVYICGKIYGFSTVIIGLLFSPKLCGLNCALFGIHHCLSRVQKIRNQKF